MSKSRSTALTVAALPCLLAGASNAAAASPSQDPIITPHPILFVTQVPVVNDYLTIGSTFGNHQAGPNSVARGGDLWIRYRDGTLRNLTAEAGYGAPPGFQGENAIAVREPCVHWSGTKAVFSMVVGAPNGPYAGGYNWQIYEVVGLARNATPVITRIPGQPPIRNNVSPCYASDGRILFTSDRPRNGAGHLYPQLDEYEEAPTTTGIWSLDPASGELFLMNHAPSGAFKPIVDRSGRVVFTRWDHLERDQQADLDRMGIGNYQVFNYSDESVTSFNTGLRFEFFPEPRIQWIDWYNQHPGYDGPPAGWAPHLIGNAFNHFLPWTLNQDGTEEETLGHVGRHELFQSIERSRNDDPNLVPKNGFPPWIANRKPITAFHQVREDPLLPGTYYGIDCREFDTHASGQVVSITGAPELNANEMVVTYVTHRDTQAPTQTPGPNHSGFYRNPLPLSDGTLIAAHTANTLKEQNIGTPSAPRSRFDFRLKELVPAQNGHRVAGQALTPGIRKRVLYFDPYDPIIYNGLLWELDPVEVVARPAPVETDEPPLPLPERLALTAEDVPLWVLKQYLRDNDLALIVSRDVTTRDRNDRQQPYNLRVPGGAHTFGATGRVYDVTHMRIFQGDLIRGITNGVSSAANGRRVLARPLHDPDADNPPAPGAPPGSVALELDGSMAALVPARRALSWQLIDPSGDPVVNERYWISFQPGEIRACTSCHGQNETDQALHPPPENVPQALRTLVRHLKDQGDL